MKKFILLDEDNTVLDTVHALNMEEAEQSFFDDGWVVGTVAEVVFTPEPQKFEFIDF